MRRAARFTPYIRRRDERDHADSLRTALRMEVFGPCCYVLVQRGVPRRVLEASRTRRDLALSLAPRSAAGSGVRAWAKRFRSLCGSSGKASR